MTEQEKREKAIEELRPIIKKGSSSCGTCARWLSFENNFFLNTLADYVLRKEEEVQKETARKILKTLFNNLKYPQYFQVYIKTLAQENGVEVEE